jgi:secreted trypsin-like serine protease
MTMALKSAIFAVLPIMLGCAGWASQSALGQTVAPDDRKIVGGVEAPEGAWPWQVSIYRRAPDGSFSAHCGGTLIHARWVLSAAHCFVREGRSVSKDDVLVVEATSRIDRQVRRGAGRGRQLEVRRIVPHERYNASLTENDIALIELASEARSQPIPLAHASDTALERVGLPATVTGWGFLRAIRIVTVDGKQQVIDTKTDQPVTVDQVITDRLMQVELPLVDRDICRRANADSPNSLDERNLCAGLREGGKDSCQGDSGGPLAVRDERGNFIQIGIVSWGIDCGRPDRFGIYTRVSAFESWIRSTAGVALARPEPAARPAPVPESAPGAAVSVPLPPLPKLAAGDRALLIGIERYKVERFNLRGTVNDVRNMRRLLIETFGFKPEQIVTLTDAQATRANILETFEQWLVAGSAPGSRVVFFMSSHGFQSPERARGSEPDGMDETLVPHDVFVETVGGRKAVRNQIIDDEIADLLKAIPDRKVMVVIDACFSGTATRDALGLARGAPGTVKHLGAALTPEELKDLEAPLPVVATRSGKAIAVVPSTGGFIKRSDNVAAWSATDDGQAALVDTEAVEPQGVFTRRLIEGLAGKRADRSGDGIVTFAELLDYVRKESRAYCERNPETCEGGLSPQLEARAELLAADVLTGQLPGRPQALVQNVLSHDNPAGLTVELVPPAPLKIGSEVRFRISTRKPGYVVLLDVTPDGKITQIFPNSRSLSSPTAGRQKSNLVNPDRPLLIPTSQFDRFTYVLDPPAGDGLLVAVLSDEPLKSVPVPQLPHSMERSAAVDYVAALADELRKTFERRRREAMVGSRTAGSPRLPADWSVAMKPYRIVP